MSSRKNVLLPYTDPLVNGQSMAASFNGTPINLQYWDNCGIQLIWTGSDPLGTITVGVSLNYNPVTQSGTWTTLQITQGTNLTVTPNGVAGNAYLDLNQLSTPWILVQYTTAANSSGNLTAIIGGKQV